MAYLSVIIPCYNGENYVDRCLTCMENQTIGIQNMELILVNDGSTDGTWERMKAWEEKYPNQIIAVTYEENRKLGAARNIGIGYVSTPYLAFMDIDDIVAPRFYEMLYEKMQSAQYDWVSSKHVHIPAGQMLDFDAPVKREDREYHCEADEILLFTDFEKSGQNGDFGILPARLFRKDFIIEHDLYFPEGLIYEDNFWDVKCNIFAKDAYIIDEVLYCYYANLGSIVSSTHTEAHLDRLQIEMMSLKLFREEGLFEKYYAQIEFRFIKKYYCDTWYAIFLKMDRIPDILPEMRRTIRENFPHFMENPYISELPEFYRLLLRLLDENMELSMEELEYIKQAVLVDLGMKDKGKTY